MYRRKLIENVIESIWFSPVTLVNGARQTGKSTFIKASMDMNPSGFNGLRSFALNAGQRFHRGFLLYVGNEVIRYDKNLWAVPVASLWL